MAVRLTVEGGTLSSDTATIAAGQTLGMRVQVTQGEAGGSVSVAIESTPPLPETVCGDYGVYNGYPCFRGLEVSVGGPVTLFGEPVPPVSIPTLRR